MMNQKQIDWNNGIDAARMQRPCGCPECDDGVQPGHFACEMPEPSMLQAEQEGKVVRAYDNGAWRWFIKTAR